MTENRENVNNAAAVDGGVNNKTLLEYIEDCEEKGFPEK